MYTYIVHFTYYVHFSFTRILLTEIIHLTAACLRQVFTQNISYTSKPCLIHSTKYFSQMLISMHYNIDSYADLISLDLACLVLANCIVLYCVLCANCVHYFYYSYCMLALKDIFSESATALQVTMLQLFIKIKRKT